MLHGLRQARGFRFVIDKLAGKFPVKLVWGILGLLRSNACVWHAGDVGAGSKKACGVCAIIPDLRTIMRNRGKPRLRGGGSRPSLLRVLRLVRVNSDRLSAFDPK
jgi:hypothetical protein